VCHLAPDRRLDMTQLGNSSLACTHKYILKPLLNLARRAPMSLKPLLNLARRAPMSMDIDKLMKLARELPIKRGRTETSA
jgi:hypothetical protein